MLYFAKWKIAVIAAIVLVGIAFSVPNFLTADQRAQIPDWLPNQSVNLGLDLQGGSHLLLEIDGDAVIRERLNDLAESMRNDLGEIRPRIRRSGFRIGDNAVSFDLRDAGQMDQALEVVRGLVTQIGGALSVGAGGPDLAVTSDGTRITATLTEAGIKARLSSAVQQSIEIVRRRVDETGVNEPTIQRQGDDRILVQLPGLDDPERIKRLLGRTAKMTFHLVDVSANPNATRLPPGSMRLVEMRDGVEVAWVVRKKVEVSGEHLVDAQTSFQDGGPVVAFRFDSVGAKRFGKVTTENVGQPFAIVLDNRIISAPRIESPILQGSGIIRGGFSVQEANDLAVLLRAGALPAPLKILEERTVGPDLGADSIAAGEIAAVIGFVVVIVFMVLSYGPVFGIASNIALFTNLILIFGALSALQATLTLPGIAGIVLTIGMAVDANVLIFERIREEIENGRSPFNAVEAGYKRAFTTIVDANVTTGFAAAILFAMGSGPVRGFSVTLFLGIICSMFTAILLSRLVVATWLRRTRPTTLTV